MEREEKGDGVSIFNVICYDGIYNYYIPRREKLRKIFSKIMGYNKHS